MAYRGIPIFKQEELTSLKRLRESAGVLPDGSGFFTATVKTPKTKEAGKKGMKWGVRHGQDKGNVPTHIAARAHRLFDQGNDRSGVASELRSAFGIDRSTANRHARIVEKQRDEAYKQRTKDAEDRYRKEHGDI